MTHGTQDLNLYTVSVTCGWNVWELVKFNQCWRKKRSCQNYLPTLRRFNLSCLDLARTTYFGNNLCLCRYGVGGGEVGLEDVVCEGGERHLLRCRHSSVWGVNATCKHQYDIAIACCRLSIWLFKLSLSIRLSVFLLVCLSACLPNCLFACLPNCLFVCLLICLSHCPSVV